MSTHTRTSRWNAYWRLMRFDRPIGILLLLWPTLWALWIAGDGTPSLKNVVIFCAGVVLMRAAGCVMNDIADRDLDSHVERTRARPLAAGEVQLKEALVLFDVYLCFEEGVDIETCGATAFHEVKLYDSVPLPIARYCSFVAPVRPIGTRSSLVVSFVQSFPSSGMTCANGTSTRFESVLLFPILWMKSIAPSGAAGVSSVIRTAARGAPTRANRSPSCSRHTLFPRSVSATKSHCRAEASQSCQKAGSAT